MDLLLSNPYAYLDALLLILVRVLGMMLVMPFLSNRNIPANTKIGLAFFFSVIMINVIPIDIQVSSADIVNYGIVVAKEFFAGWLIGFSAYFVFTILSLAGQFVDAEIGFSMVNVFDPMSQTQITITGNFYYFLFLLFFLITRSYYFLFRGLKTSFILIPLGQMQLSSYLYDTVIEYFQTVLLISIQIAAPIFFVMLVTNVVLGVLARTVPQLNMFVIGFPIKILLGLIVLFLTLYLFDNVAEIIINQFITLMDKFIRGMAP
jgi:flagellar biosynthesis protein FliR